MRDVDAAAARDAVLAAVEPFVDAALGRLPRLPAAPGLDAAVIVQLHPTVGRLLLMSPGGALEAVRMTEPELPGHVELGEAAEAFITAGCSALPEPVADGIFDHASKPGGGLILLVDLTRGGVEALLAPRGVPLSRAEKLFSVKVDCTNPHEPAGTVTVH